MVGGCVVWLRCGRGGVGVWGVWGVGGGGGGVGQFLLHLRPCIECIKRRGGTAMGRLCIVSDTQYDMHAVCAHQEMPTRKCGSRSCTCAALCGAM